MPRHRAFSAASLCTASPSWRSPSRSSRRDRIHRRRSRMPTDGYPFHQVGSDTAVSVRIDPLTPSVRGGRRRQGQIVSVRATGWHTAGFWGVEERRGRMGSRRRQGPQRLAPRLYADMTVGASEIRYGQTRHSGIWHCNPETADPSSVHHGNR